MLSAQYSWADWLVQDLDYVGLPTLIVGPLFAIGALGGDALKSFFKRQVGIRPGGTWFPFDQIDYIIGGAIASQPRYVDPAPAAGINPRHIEWCASRYRSYRAHDNTFQPNYGPRQQCYSPYF